MVGSLASAACRRVLELDAEPQIAPEGCVRVYECLGIEILWVTLDRKCCLSPDEQPCMAASAIIA